MSLDTWVALIAGPNPWTTDDEARPAWDRLVSLLQIILLGSTISTLLWARPPHHHVLLTAGGIGIVLLGVPPVLRLAGLGPVFHSVWINAVIRIAAFSAIILAVYAQLPGWQALWAAPFAVLLGVDAAFTSSELGLSARPLRWYRRFVLSAFDFGVFGALIAALVMGGGSLLTPALTVFVSLHVCAANATVVLSVISRLQQAHERERAQAVAEAIEDEHRVRAHWLHDDVCAQLRLASLKLQTESATNREIVQLLDEVDHQLRLRQLDELFGSGTVRVAEVLQPFIRYAQNHGVSIDGVPAFENAAVSLDERSARLAARAASVLTSNAMNAGATAISYEVSSEGGMLRLTISDNGPGFVLADVPHGRGLWVLIDDLKPGGLEVVENPGGGARVTASIPYKERRVGGHDLARR